MLACKVLDQPVPNSSGMVRSIISRTTGPNARCAIDSRIIVHQVDSSSSLVVLVELDVGVAGDVERIRGDDLGAGEEPRQVGGDDLLQPGEDLRLRRVDLRRT